ncbi:hypothetical protein F9K94_06215 [Brucella tritici]|uniref:Replication protein n=1 Tax=Brucella tritici TaxID=94626 RepID=A0A7V7VVD9_9HYPH|nr:hypothetical protein [Brucella tritici]KAB2657813.1 hypothetical protein F9K94_06215 [Brucella tritici]
MKKAVRTQANEVSIDEFEDELLQHLASYENAEAVKLAHEMIDHIKSREHKLGLRRIKGTLVPANFESFEQARRERRLICNAVDGLQNDVTDPVMFFETCADNGRCNSGFCPVCERLFRLRLVRFVTQNKLRKLKWYMVTVIVKDWNIAPGDFTRFGYFNDHPVVEKICEALSSTKTNTPVLAFGSVETVFNLVDNEPYAKPFHIHLMVSGLARNAIRKAIGGTGVLCDEANKPLEVRQVNPSVTSFLRAATYVCKQPLKQRRKTSAPGAQYGSPEFPYPKLLGELISNYGDIKTGDRWVSIGINYRHDQFLLSDKVKLKVVQKIKRRVRTAKAKRVKLRRP